MYRNQESLIDAYITQDMTKEEVADYFGVGVTTIKNYLRKFGIKKKRPRPFEDKEWLYGERYLQHRHVEDIAKEYRVSKKTIENFIKICNILKPLLIKDIYVEVLCHCCKKIINRNFRHLQYRIRNKGIFRFFCEDCTNDRRREWNTGENSATYKGELPTVNCLQCGKKYTVHHYRYDAFERGGRKPLCCATQYRKQDKIPTEDANYIIVVVKRKRRSPPIYRKALFNK